MFTKDTNIVLIGMPGSGKSTIGMMLAKRLGCHFVDTDHLIQKAQGRTLQCIVDSEGYLTLRRIEEEILLGLDYQGHVVATGGSAVYSHAAMTRLKAGGRVIFLDVQLNTLLARIRNYANRGLAKRPEQSLADLFAERRALYRRYADVTLRCDGLTHGEICSRIGQVLRQSAVR